VIPWRSAGDELADVRDPLLSFGQRIFAATKATPPAPRTTPVGAPFASFSIVPPRGSGVARRSRRL